MRLAIAAVLLVAGCYDPKLGAAPFKCAGGACPDGYLCETATDTCLLGFPDAAPPRPDAFLCNAGEFQSCNADSALFCSKTGDQLIEQPCGGNGCEAASMGCLCAANTTSCQGDFLVTCDATGHPSDQSECLLGCDTAGPACLVLEPSNVAADVCDTVTTNDLIVMGEMDLGTDSGCTAVVDQGGSSPSICVVIVRDLTIPSGATLTVTGSRALALVTIGTMTIDGAIDISSVGVASGPGGPTASGNGSAGAPTSQSGGGGGHGGIGGDGSSTSTAGDGGNGGGTFGDAQLVPLNAGGAGGAGANNGGMGGGGGGALQLVGCRTITVSATGVIRGGGGGGGGGAGGTVALDAPGGGGGGGAGGGILIEAARVTIDGGLFANGGGGGGGGERAVTGSAGAAGENGADALTPAGGGTPGTPTSGSGGAGALDGVAAAAGGVPSNGMQAAGGGGGGVGRIRINVRMSTVPMLGGTVSPAPSFGAVGTH